MNERNLTALRNDLATLVKEAMHTRRIAVLAEKIRRKHEHVNIGLEDVEAMAVYAVPIESDVKPHGALQGSPKDIYERPAVRASTFPNEPASVCHFSASRLDS